MPFHKPLAINLLLRVGYGSDRVNKKAIKLVLVSTITSSALLTFSSLYSVPVVNSTCTVATTCPTKCDLSKEELCPGDGCTMPDSCISKPMGMDGTRCNAPCPITCPDGDTLCPGGFDSNGCPIADTCISTGISHTIYITISTLISVCPSALTLCVCIAFVTFHCFIT